MDVENRRVQVCWTTGARVLRGGWFTDPYFEELSLDPKHVRMGRLQSGAAPLLACHNQWDLRDVIGVVESAELKPKGGTAWVRFDKGPEGEDAMRKVADGILRNLSVGYRTYKLVKVEDGEGRTPVRRAEDWEPHEISLVPIGADAGAVTRGAGVITNPCEFIEERTMDPEETETPSTTPTPAPTADQVRAAAAAAERQRLLDIQRIGRALDRPQTEIDAAVNGGTTVEAFRAAAVDARAAAAPEQGGVIPFDRRDPRIQPGEDSRDKWLRGASASLIVRAGVASTVSAAAKLTGETVDLDGNEFRGLRFIDLARECLERSGVKTRRMSAMELVGLALTQRSGGLATTGDFPILLENTLNKLLLAGYAITPDTWQSFCKRGTVSDFRAHIRYRLGSFGALDDLNEAGEFQNKAIPDGEKNSITAGTKGNVIGISRQAIINDDLSAFATLATGLGRAGKLTIEMAVYTAIAKNSGLGPTMSDGKALFHADHGNIGSGAALSAAALDANAALMAVQKDPSSNELLDLNPSVLLVPRTLKGAAHVINDSQYDPDTVANKAQMKANIAGKMFETIIGTGRITGTRRYLFAHPTIAPVLEVAFLDGNEQPYMEMKEGWRVDGVEWKVRLDLGVAAIDYRGAVTDAGA